MTDQDSYERETRPAQLAGGGHQEPNSRRQKLIAAAQELWIDALTDLGGRNTLLYFKDRRVGTLDLAGADPAALDKFLRAGSIRLTRLFTDVDLRADAIRRVQAIYRRAKELLEERGVRAGYLATGIARWDELFLEPAAPVLLRGLTIAPTRARHDDFELLLDDDTEVNPVLLHKLASAFGAATEQLAEEPPGKIADLLTTAAEAAEVPGFQILPRQVIGTFTYAKLPMVRDLQAAGDVLYDSDVVAAIAGDPEAQEMLAADDDSDSWTDSPEQDYSVLDADSSQRSAINTVLSGRSLVIHGPPGTGKSQTIANLIAALVARGRKVLFVAEKRAAIDAVLSRLKNVGLGGAVLDIHDGTRDRMRICRDLGETLQEAQSTGDPDVSDLHRRLADRQRRLARHVSGLHQVHQPWGVTPFQIQSALLGIAADARTPVRIAAPERISDEQADRIRDELREFAHLGGFLLRPDTTAWFGSALRTADDARRAIELASRLSSRGVPILVRRAAQVCAEAGLRPPGSYAEAVARTQLLVSVRQTLGRLAPAVFAADPAKLAVAVGDGTGLSFLERRALRKQARALAIAGDQLPAAELGSALAAAAAQLEQWHELSGGTGEPRPPAGLDELAVMCEDCERQVAELRTFVDIGAEPERLLAELAADQDTAWKLPRLYELGSRFSDLGIGALLDELALRAPEPALVAAAFDHAWYSSILDEIRVRDNRYAADGGAALDEIASDFRVHDVQHLDANAARVRKAWARALADACDRHPLQARVIRKQAALRRGHLPLRRLLDQTSDVLFAIKPCWAMSPLMVSQVLPPSRLFDVVIFDEASQIVPADAIPAIVRGHQIVVAGDDRQLPPTNFFRQISGHDDDGADEIEDEDSLVSFGVGFESVLDALRPLLPTAPLAWHYRSRDERLVAFSNSRIYGGALTTFPGVFRDDCLRHVVVAQGPGSGQETSVTAEVDKVVGLILEHARDHPDESLGVIALGIRHAERIDTALREKLAQMSDGENADLEAFFAEDAQEPFFVKNLERVQGDERDAIIFSIGYGKHPDGRMRYQWGPLLRDGGERRLNVAATRAKHRLTLVSSFSGHDVDPERVTKAGARLLADYLDYASSGGTAPEASGAAVLDSFEADVRDRLAECGITVVPQYGVGGYRVDFAATHPEDPGRMVLAIEADGASYRESGSVRDRDRLRGEHLQRLGWRYHRLWSTNWFRDPAREVERVREAYEHAISAIPAPPAAPEPDPAPAAQPAPMSAAELAARAAGSASGPAAEPAAQAAGPASRPAAEPASSSWAAGSPPPTGPAAPAPAARPEPAATDPARPVASPVPGLAADQISAREVAPAGGEVAPAVRAVAPTVREAAGASVAAPTGRLELPPASPAPAWQAGEVARRTEIAPEPADTDLTGTARVWVIEPGQAGPGQLPDPSRGGRPEDGHRAD
jgi:very-short-patch-repair endonuclease